MPIFENYNFLIYFVSVPIVLTIFILYFVWKKYKRRKIGNRLLISNLVSDFSGMKYWVKAFLILLFISSVIVALMNPRVGTKEVTVNRKGVDIVFVLDVSKSMLAEDIKPSRIEKSKQLISKIIDNLKGDRVGIIIYAGGALPVLPITTDYAAAKLFLDNISNNFLSSKGTAIGNALERTSDYFDDSQKNRMVILISDGEDHEKGLDEVLNKIKKQEVKINTVGVGTINGAPIPIKNSRGKVISYKKDKDGKRVITKLVPSSLMNISKKTGGIYVDGRNTETAVAKLSDNIQNSEKTTFASKKYTEYKNYFQWFLMLGIVLLVLEMLLLDRKTDWLQSLNLFGDNKKDE